MRKLIICLKCKEKKKLGGKGLCQKCYSKLHYLNNKEKYCQRSRQQNIEMGKELLKEQNRRYYLTHREKIRAKVKKYQEENVEKIKLMKKIYRSKTMGLFSDYMKTCRKEHSGYFQIYNKSYQKKNRQTFEGKLEHRIDSLRRRTGFDARIARKIVNDNLFKYGVVCCEKCKSIATNNYHIDHIIPIIKGGDNSYNNLQVLCKSCNYAKRIEIIDYRESSECGQLFLGGG